MIMVVDITVILIEIQWKVSFRMKPVVSCIPQQCSEFPSSLSVLIHDVRYAAFRKRSRVLCPLHAEPRVQVQTDIHSEQEYRCCCQSAPYTHESRQSTTTASSMQSGWVCQLYCESRSLLSAWGTLDYVFVVCD